MPIDSDHKKPRSYNKKIVLCVILFVIVGIAFMFLPVGKWLESLKHYIEALGWLGPLVFVLLYAIFTMALIPGSALTLGAGAIFGLGWGIALVVLGSNLGALGSFLLARTLLHKRVEEWSKSQPRFQAVSETVAKGGLKIIVLLRLSPIFPFTMLNYLLGITRVPIPQYAFGNLIGMLPGIVAFVYLGTLPTAMAGASNGGQSTVRYVLYGVGLLATIAVTVIITRMAKRALARQS